MGVETMALKQGEKFFCRWHHSENGKDMQRKIHVLEVQATDGRVYTIQGKELPESIMTCSGEKYQGRHLMQILLRPGKKCIAPSAQQIHLLCGRDILAACIGAGLFVVAVFSISLLERIAALL